MPKQLNVNLAFTADTAQAKQQIQELQRSLQELNTNTIKNSGLSKMSEDVLKAQQSVQKLSSILNSSLNADTGRLDLSKFNQQLGSAGMSIQSLATDMTALGADGQKAFLNLANSIVTTQKPMVETNKLLDGMWTALQNTARWQMSSSMLHGFMGAIQGAYGYAQDLNRSLTDIAIVTGNSVDNMAAFADQANKSAQALSTSTLAYTDAALIYYQQGLNDEEVQARTETTLKMSNVTRQSAEEVSSYMTAIWNNFYDGSESLESFADKITALGAATASSSEEIATGLQQFAALGSSLGLNYDDAVAALATVVAQTRQSASTVGNSFRTLFQRIESLKLGDTLEDGVGLTKYSEALAKVGVQVLDVNGEMRDMHDVIQDLGAVWQTLGREQQNALAQTVGGVRNSNTLIAWMDHFDEFQKNLGVAENSEGALQKQADIYAESWEAAQKRVKAAWQSIYQDLIDSNFFIGLLDSLEKVLKGIDLFIDSVGGIPGVLSVIGVAITGLFGDQILSNIQKAQQQLKIMTGVAKEESDYIVQQTKEALDKLVPQGSEDSADAMRVQSLKDQVDLNYKLKGAIDELAVSNKHLTESQTEQLNSLIKTTQQYGEAAAKAREYQEAASVDAANARSNLRNKLLDSNINPNDSYYAELLNGNRKEDISRIAEIKDVKKANDAIDDLTQEIYKYDDGVKVTAKDVNDFIRTQVELAKSNESVSNSTKNYTTQFKAAEIQIEAEKRAVQENISIQEAQKQVIQENIDKVQETLNSLEAKKEKTEEDTQAIEKNKAALESLNNMMSQANNAPTQNFNTGIYSPEFAQNLTNTITAVTRITMAFNSLKSAWDTIQDPNLSGWEKFTRVTTSLGMALPTIIGLFSKFGAATVKHMGATLADTIATEKNTLAEMENSKAKAMAVLAEDGLSKEIIEEILSTETAAIAKQKDKIATLENAAAHFTLGGAINFVTTSFSKFIASTWAFFTTNPIGIAILAIAAAVGALTFAMKAAYDASPEGKLEAANKRLEEAKTKAQEATDAYNELKSTLDEYKQAKEDINNIEDSDERQRAINEENEKILEMLSNIENWHDLIGDLQYDGNGLISLTEEQIKALENDKAREESLAKQLELQEKINANTAEQDVENSKYSGKKINVTTGRSDAHIRYDDDDNFSAGVRTDETANIAKILAEAGLGLNSEQSKIDEALSKYYDPSVLTQINEGLDAIRADEESSKQFEEMQASQLQTIAENNAFEKQSNQLSIDQAQREMGDNLSLSSLSQFESVQAQIAEEWNALDEATKQTILSSVDAEEALKNALADRINIEEANNEALRQQEEEHKKWKEQNINSLSDQMTGIQEAGGNQDYIKAQLNQFSDEDLKIAATLELDQYASISQLKADIEAIKQQTEEDRRFEIEMKRAEDLGLDMDQWKMYVDYLQSVNEKMAENDELAAQVATANMRLNRGVESLVDDFDDWRKVLDTANKEGNEWSKNNIDYAESMTGIQEALADIANTDLDTIRGLGDTFVEDNLDLIQEAAYGDVDAIDELIKKIAEAQLMKLEIPAGVDSEQFDADRQALIDAIYDTNFNEIEIGASIEDAPFYEALMKMVSDGAIAASEINDYLNNIGYTPIVEYKTVTATAYAHDEGAATGTITYRTDDGQTVTAEVEHNDSYNNIKGETQVQVPIIKGSNGTQIANASNMAAALSSSSFNGGTGKFTSPSNRNNGNANRPKNKSSCFAAGTLVAILNNNYKNIENINIGDIVLSYNEKTKQNEYSTVLQTMIHNVFENIYNLFIKNDKLSVTGNHKFLVARNNKQEWIQASEIKIGDLVLLADGTLCEVSNITVNKKFITVYNFEVSNTHNYYVGENRILAHNKSKNKSGGKEKEREKKEKKELEEKKKEEDRYHDIEEAVDDLNTSIERLDKNKERAYGKDKLNYMNLESKKLKEHIELTKKYIKEIEKYQKTDRKALEDKLKDIGMTQDQISSQFDANGVLKSYEDLFSKIQDHFNNTAVKDLNAAREEYNKQVERWNNGELDEDTWKDVEEKLKEAEAIYKKQEEAFKGQVDALKQYEDTTNKLQEKEQELLDQQNELFDKALKVVSTKIELKLSIADSEQKYLEWVYDNIGDSADRAADRIALLGRRAQESTKKVAANAEGLRNMLSEVQSYYTGKDKDHPYVNFKGIDMELDINDPNAMLKTLNQVIERMQKAGLEAPAQTIIDTMNGYRDALMEEYNNLRDINNMVTENMVNAFDDMMDSLSNNLDKNDHFQTLMDYHKNIRDLLGQEELGLSDEEIRKWNQQMLDIKRDAAQVAQANYNAAHEATEKARKEYEEAIASGNQFRIDRAKEVLEATEEKEHEFEEEFLDRWEQTLQMAKEMYEQALEDNEKAYQRSLSGGILPTLDKLQDQFDMQKEINDLHLDDYEKYKKLGDLQANINKQLANNPNVKVQGKLKDLMDDVNDKMAAGAEISEGEATILEKRLQLLQAEDQLMAARNAKSAVRMTRDNEGNFSYTYTADTSKIEEAQQNYADKFYDLLDYERQYSEDTQAAILQSYKEFLDKRNDIINDDSLTQSEKEALLRQLEKDMEAKVQFYTNEMEMVTGEMARFKDKDWTDMQKTLGRMLAEPDDFETKFEDTTLGKLAPAWKDAESALNGFIQTAKGLNDADLYAYNKWAAENEISMKNVGTTTEEYGRNATQIYQGLKDDSTEAKEASKEMAEQVSDDFETILDEGRKFDSQFGEYLIKLTDNLDKVVRAINDVTKALSGVDEDLSMDEWFNRGLGEDLGNTSEILDEDPTKDYNFSTPHSNSAYKKQKERIEEYEEALDKFNNNEEERLKLLENIEKENNWGSLSDALLHSKSGKGAGRKSVQQAKNNQFAPSDITDTILDAFNATNDFSLLDEYRNAANRLDFSGVSPGELVQQVHIEASFPNVQSHSEIELAFNNLINSASQYVNRKR